MIKIVNSTDTRWMFFFQAEDGIRYLVRSRGLGDVYKRQVQQLYPLAAGFAEKAASDGYLEERIRHRLGAFYALSLIHI